MLFVFLFFRFIFKKSRAADDRLSSYVLLNETIYLYGTDGFRTTDLQRNYYYYYYYLQLKKEELKNSLY